MWIICVFDDSCHYILRQGLCLLSHGITGRCWVLGIQTEVLMHAQQVLYPWSFSPSIPKYFVNKYIFWTTLFVFAWCTIWILESGSEHSGTLSCRLPTTSGLAKLPSSLLPCISSQVDLGCLGTILLSWVFPTAHPFVTESCGDCSGSVPSLYHDLLWSFTISVKKWPLWRCFPIN